MHRILACLAFPVLLCRCAFPGAEETIDPNPYQLLERQAGPANRDPSKVRVPVLKAEPLAKTWGRPKLLVNDKGSYGLRYGNPRRKSESITIYGTAKSYPIAGPVPPRYSVAGLDAADGTYKPRAVSPVWYFAKLADGKVVRYSVIEEGGAAAPWQFATETFRHTAKDGREASYRIFVTLPGKSPHLEVGRLLESVAY